jgi:hypothetical protein
MVEEAVVTDLHNSLEVESMGKMIQEQSKRVIEREDS